jgi:hypothetical protein
MKAPSWRTVEQMEQARWRKFARAHAPEHERCAVIAGLAYIGKAEAVELAAIARENGWRIERAGSPAKPRRR